MLFLAYLLVAKYVFFEKGITGKANINFHVVALIGILVSSIFIKDVKSGIPSIVLIVWLLKERKEKKVRGLLLLIPIMGIVDGLTQPIIGMPYIFDSISATGNVYGMIVCGILAAVMVVVTVKLEKGKLSEISHLPGNLGSMVDLDSHNRQLSKTEKLLLYFVGVFEMFFAAAIQFPFREFTNRLSNTSGNSPIGDFLTEEEYMEYMISQFASGDTALIAFKTLVCLLGIATFSMTVIVIIVVLSGNKRSYYFNKVSDIQYNIIVTMADIVENRDQDTGGHIQRTAKYVEIIANQMKQSGPYQALITDQFLEDIKVAAPLHDIGKIHVSDTILNFPGRLNDEQFAIMKTHAAEGKKLLAHAKQRLGEFSYLDVAIDMAAYHHEWWDGSAKGYPDQIKGEEIPLCARIMAVADVFDALTARRVYKEPMPVQKAIDIIVSERDTHFDPSVVDAFMEAIELVKVALNEFEMNSVNATNM